MKKVNSILLHQPFSHLKFYGFLNKSFFIVVFFALSIGQVLAQGVTVSETIITTSEGGSARQYTLVLTASPDPGETVTITPMSTDATEGSVSGAVMFDQSDWDVPQSVTLTPLDDGVADGDVLYTINNVVSSTGGSYTGIMAASIMATNIDNEGPTIIVDPSSAIVVDEAGMVTQVVTIETTTVPTMDVTIDLTNNSPTEVSLSTASVVLTAGNGYSATVTITGVPDMIVEGTQPFSITTEPAVSGDLGYNGIDPTDIFGSVLDQVVAAVPTLGQWGLILLSLLILISGTVTLRKRELVLAGSGMAVSSNQSRLPFDKAAFGKMLMIVMIGLAAVFAVAISMFGYEMTAADVPGSLVAGPMLAYLLHLLVKNEK